MKNYKLTKKRGIKEWIVTWKSGDVLGRIEWSPSRRRYCYFQETYLETFAYTYECLFDIGQDVKDINKIEQVNLCNT
jgi:hypothetical protein